MFSRMAFLLNAACVGYHGVLGFGLRTIRKLCVFWLGSCCTNARPAGVARSPPRRTRQCAAGRHGPQPPRRGRPAFGWARLSDSLGLVTARPLVHATGRRARAPAPAAGRGPRRAPAGAAAGPLAPHTDTRLGPYGFQITAPDLARPAPGPRARPRAPEGPRPSNQIFGHSSVTRPPHAAAGASRTATRPPLSGGRPPRRGGARGAPEAPARHARRAPFGSGMHCCCPAPPCARARAPGAAPGRRARRVTLRAGGYSCRIKPFASPGAPQPRARCARRRHYRHRRRHARGGGPARCDHRPAPLEPGARAAPPAPRRAPRAAPAGPRRPAGRSNARRPSGAARAPCCPDDLNRRCPSLLAGAARFPPKPEPCDLI